MGKTLHDVYDGVKDLRSFIGIRISDEFNVKWAKNADEADKIISDRRYSIRVSNDNLFRLVIMDINILKRRRSRKRAYRELRHLETQLRNDSSRIYGGVNVIDDTTGRITVTNNVNDAIYGRIRRQGFTFEEVSAGRTVYIVIHILP